MRADGTAANKAAAMGPTTDASKCMSIATHNGETFSAGDTIYLSGKGGTYTAKLWPLSSGSSGNVITYAAAPGESPIIDMTGQADHCITCYGRSYITISNLRVTGADNTKYGIFTGGNSHHLIIDSCTVDTNYRGIGFSAAGNNDVYDITISNCIIYDNDQYGIWWATGDNDPGEDGKAYNITILNNSIYNNSLYGIKGNTNNLAGGSAHYASALTIQNNLIYGNDRYGIEIADVDNDQGASTISNNTIYNNGDNPGGNNANGLWLGNCSYIIVENNILYNNNTGNADGVGILLDTRGAGYETNNCTVRYNLCYSHDSRNDQTPWGAGTGFNSSAIGLCCGAHDNEVYYNICHSNAVGITLGCLAGATTKNNKIYNNSLVNNRLGIQIDLQDAGATGNDIQNNIIAHNTMGAKTNYGMYIDVTTAVASGDITIDYNAWYDNDTDFSDNSGEGWSQGANKVEADPVFYNINNNNYKLMLPSPCRNTGNNALWSGTASITDYAGNAITDGSGNIIAGTVDIGAHEFPSFNAQVNPYYSLEAPIVASVKVTDESVIIQKIVWSGITTAGHLLSLIDKGGNTLYKCSADAPGASGILKYSNEFPLGLTVRGIYCDDLDSGEVFIYLK